LRPLLKCRAREGRLKKLAQRNRETVHAQQRARMQNEPANGSDDRAFWEKRGWGGPRGSFGLIADKTGPDRRESITSDRPGYFSVEKYTDAEEGPTVWEFDRLGRDAVAQNDKEIEIASRRNGIDPDLVRAVMWVENSRGHKLGLNMLADTLGLSDSKLPMNIRPDMWGSLADGDASELDDAGANIDASARLLKGIITRLTNPNPESVGTAWNNLSADKTNDVGAAIARIYRERPWRKEMD